MWTALRGVAGLDGLSTGVAAFDAIIAVRCGRDQSGRPRKRPQDPWWHPQRGCRHRGCPRAAAARWPALDRLAARARASVWPSMQIRDGARRQARHELPGHDDRLRWSGGLHRPEPLADPSRDSRPQPNPYPAAEARMEQSHDPAARPAARRRRRRPGGGHHRRPARPRAGGWSRCGTSPTSGARRCHRPARRASPSTAPAAFAQRAVARAAGLGPPHLRLCHREHPRRADPGAGGPGVPRAARGSASRSVAHPAVARRHRGAAVPTPPTRSAAWLSTSAVRPDAEAVRRNAYYRMFGMDLAHGTDAQRAVPVRQGGGVQPHLRRAVRGAALRAVAGHREHPQPRRAATPPTTTGSTGSPSSSASCSAPAGRTRCSAGEELSAATAMGWVELTARVEHAGGGRPARAGDQRRRDRLRIIGERVRLLPHSRAELVLRHGGRALTAPARAGGRLGDRTTARAWLLYHSVVPPGRAAASRRIDPARRARCAGCITEWAAASGRDLKQPGRADPRIPAGVPARR